uniref:Golgin subfamily A member 1 n=1 Tax=Catharus ustulatus TaxID=91951 RepID=A0A8C3V7A8_CATUS
MFAKLKKKIAEEAAVAPRPGGAARIPRSVSKESITSVGADSGDDFASDGSSSREDLSSQLFRRNEQIRKLEVKLSDYADQIRNLQKMKEKLENALEKHQDSSMRKFQEQNEAHQASRAKMAEGMALALGKKDKEWMEILAQVEKEKKMLQTQLQEMREQSLNLFQKRDEIDELEGFQQQEIAKVKHMLLKKEESLSRAEQELEARAQELSQAQAELQAARSESSGLRRDLQDLQQHLLQLEARRYGAEDFPGAVDVFPLYFCFMLTSLQKRFSDFSFSQMTLEFAERDKLTEELQEKVSSLEKKLERNLSGDEHVQELLKEVISQLEKENENLKGSKEEYESSLKQQESELNRLKNEMSSRETVSVEIAKALEETRKQREELQQQKIRPDSEVPELRTNSEVPNASVTVTNNSDLNDSREINFEYLKHVVLKFMSCRESEAFHLIKAVSVLLNFSQEEENMLKETLEYKMSWFGSKPSPKGSIRPSISSPRTLWP